MFKEQQNQEELRLAWYRQNGYVDEEDYYVKQWGKEKVEQAKLKWGVSLAHALVYLLCTV